MDGERLEKQLAFLREIDRVKSVLRRTILMDGSRRENDAEHMWHMAVCAMLFEEYAPEKPDMLKTLRMILLHDVVEIDAGDTYAYDEAGRATQPAREKRAAERIFGLLPDGQREEFCALWEEFDAASTPEARYARLADAFMPLYHNICTNGKSWIENGARKPMVLERAAMIEKSSPELGKFVRSLVDEAVRKGWLAE